MKSSSDNFKRDEDHQAVSEALMRVVEGSWRENYECHEDVLTA
jgi:hypothetical protein